MFGVRLRLRLIQICHFATIKKKHFIVIIVIIIIIIIIIIVILIRMIIIIIAITRRRRITTRMLINKFLSILMTAELEEKAEATGSEVNGVVSQNLEDLVCETKAEDVRDVIKEGVL